jgi:hypothetical protein
MHDGERYRMLVNDFAIPRMEPGKQRPIQSIEEARDWERLFVGEIKAGRDPRHTPIRKQTATDLRHVAGFLDAYFERQVRPSGLRSLGSLRSRIKVLKQYLGDLPVTALENPEVVNRFKTDSEYADEVEISTLHKVLATLHPLGPGANAAGHREVAVSSLRCAAEQEGGSHARSPHLARRREAATGCRARDEHVGASLRRPAHARSHHRRVGAVLPAR